MLEADTDTKKQMDTSPKRKAAELEARHRPTRPPRMALELELRLEPQDSSVPLPTPMFVPTTPERLKSDELAAAAPTPAPPASSVDFWPARKLNKPAGELVGGYEMGALLGEGSCAKVRRAQRDGKSFACKVINRERARESRVLSPEREIALHRAVSSHPNIVTLEGVGSTPSSYFLFLQLASGGDLFDRLINLEENMPEEDCARILKDILSGLAHMHGKGIAHRDIKVENVLLETAPETGVVERAMLCDFGFSTEVRRSDDACGTLDYAAPEVLTARRCSYDPHPTDIWSAGVVFYVLLTGNLPFDAPCKRDIRYRIARDEPALAGTGISYEARLLLLQMLKKEPASRPSAAECLASPFFQGKGNDVPA